MIRFSNIKHGDALLSALASAGAFSPYQVSKAS